MNINLVELTYYTLFLETFLSVTAIYALVFCTLLKNNITNLLIQDKLSDCFGFIFFMSCFLILNENLQLYVGFNKHIIVDNLSIFSKFLICFFSSLFFYIISDYLKENKLTFEFVVLLLFAIIGLILLCSTNDLLLAFLSFELVSLVSYILASFKKNSKYSVESGIKYLIVGAISTSFFLLGTSFLYFFTGSALISDFQLLFYYDKPFSEIIPLPEFRVTPYEALAYAWAGTFDTHYAYQNHGGFNMVVWTDQVGFGFLNDFFFFSRVYEDLRSEGYKLEIFALLYNIFFVNDSTEVFFNPFIFKNSIVEIGLLLIMVSIFIKLAISPFHLWSLEVYENSPTIATFFFVAITKLSFFVLLFRISYSLIYFYNDLISYYSLVVGVLSIFIGSFGNLRQRKIKTIFAYSSINHMGYLLISFGTCSYLSIEMIFFYLFTYMLSNIIIWYVILTLRKAKSGYKNKKSTDLGDIVLLNKSNKSLAFGLLVVFFSIAGIPPFVGFLAKLGIYLSLINREFYFIATISILCSIVSTFYYIRLIKIMYFENTTVGKLYEPLNSDKSIIFCFLVFSLVFLFFKPTLLYLVIHKIVLNFNFY